MAQDKGQTSTTATTPRTSPSSRVSRPSASAPACTSGPPACAACTTSSTRSSTTPSTRPSPATRPASTSRSTPTTRSRSSTTAAASRSRRWRRRAGRPLEVVLTVLHAGGKFGDGGGYKVSGGLHGVGVSVVNALTRDGSRSRSAATATSGRQEYERGTPRTTSARARRRRRPARSISFLPGRRRSSRRSTSTSRSSSSACARPRSSPAACRSRSPTSAAAATASSSSTRAASRTSSATSTRARSRSRRRSSSSRARASEGAVEVALQWNSSYQESVFSFANNINTHEGGSHLSGFRSALTRTLNRYAREKGELKEKDDNLTGEDVREGLTAVISAKLADPQFEGQTKTKLGNPGMEGFVASIVNQKLAEFLEENPADGARDHPQGGLGRAGAVRSAQGARPHAAQERAGELAPAGQARRLLGEGPGAERDLHRRGRLRRRLGQAGPRPQHAGGAAAARQDPQRREARASTRSCATRRSRR